MQQLSKIYVLHNSRANTYLGCINNQQKKHVIFGFRSMYTVEFVQKHLKYVPVDNMIDEIVSNRYLIRTVFNKENVLTKTPIDTHIQTFSLYNSAILSGVNNLALGIVDHVYERDDGDIELVCIRTKDINSHIPKIEDDIIRYTLELLYRN